MKRLLEDFKNGFTFLPSHISFAIWSLVIINVGVRLLEGCNQDAQILQVLCTTDKSIVKHWNCRKSRRPSSKRLGQCEVWCEAGPSLSCYRDVLLTGTSQSLFTARTARGKTTLLIRRLPLALRLSGDRRWYNAPVTHSKDQTSFFSSASAPWAPRRCFCPSQAGAGPGRKLTENGNQPPARKMTVSSRNWGTSRQREI